MEERFDRIAVDSIVQRGRNGCAGRISLRVSAPPREPLPPALGPQESTATHAVACRPGPCLRKGRLTAQRVQTYGPTTVPTKPPAALVLRKRASTSRASVAVRPATA